MSNSKLLEPTNSELAFITSVEYTHNYSSILKSYSISGGIELEIWKTNSWKMK